MSNYISLYYLIIQIFMYIYSLIKSFVNILKFFIVIKIIILGFTNIIFYMYLYIFVKKNFIYYDILFL